MRNEHKRVKHRHFPGDVPKRVKITMREEDRDIPVFPWQTISRKAAKSYRQDLAKRSKKIQRRRDQTRIEEEL